MLQFGLFQATANDWNQTTFPITFNSVLSILTTSMDNLANSNLNSTAAYKYVWWISGAVRNDFTITGFYSLYYNHTIKRFWMAIGT